MKEKSVQEKKTMGKALGLFITLLMFRCVAVGILLNGVFLYMLYEQGGRGRTLIFCMPKRLDH